VGVAECKASACSARGADSLKNLLAGYETIVVFGEQKEQLEGDTLELEETTSLAEFKGAGIKLEAFKSNCFVRHGPQLAGAPILRVQGVVYKVMNWLGRTYGEK
jgi:hypothetical protein